MAVFVTGGSGFVGRALVSRLVGDGQPVVALARSSRAAEVVSRAGATPWPGDVDDGTRLREGMAGCDLVFHVAGVNETCPRDAAAMYRVNVDGTRRVVAAAATAGVSRVVVTSSAAAIGEEAGAVADEATIHSGTFLSDYARTKKLGEDAAFAEGRRQGIEVVSVNPSSVQGPGRTEGSARILLAVMRRRRPILVRSTLSFVDVSDCTEGHLLAAARGTPGHRYLISGATLSMPELVVALSEATGVAIRPRYVPTWLLASVGTSLSVAVAGVRRGPVCPALVRTLLHGHRCDGSLAERELGLRYTPILDTLTRTVAWYREHGLLAAVSR